MLSTKPVLIALTVALISSAQNASFSASSIDAHGAIVNAGQVSSAIAFVVDTATTGGELIDVVSSDPAIVVSVIAPGGVTINSLTASSLGFQFFQQTVDPNSADGVTLFDVAGTHSVFVFPAGSSIGTYQVQADGSHIAAPALVSAMFASVSSISAGLSVSSLQVIAGSQITLLGALSNGGQPIVGATVQVSYYQDLRSAARLQSALNLSANNK